MTLSRKDNSLLTLAFIRPKLGWNSSGRVLYSDDVGKV